MKTILKRTFSNSDLQFIINRIAEYGGIERLGHVFTTNKNGYFYDKGTGKVICLEPDEFSFFTWLFDKKCNYTYEDLQLNVKRSSDIAFLSDIRKVITDEHLLQAPIKTTFISEMHREQLDGLLENGVGLITLELTEECNLRCSYCIYSDHFDKARGFSKNEMSQETVKAAIEFLARHGANKVAVAFYGGEPLLKFDLIKYAVTYAKQCMSDKELSFTMTSNMTLMTKEMASYFASIDNFSIMCSIDGPEDVHDQYRTYKNGKGSYKDAMSGLLNLVNAYKERYGVDYKSKLLGGITFSMVFGPPYTNEKVSKLRNFFDEMSYWLPVELAKTLTYPEEGSLNREISQVDKAISYNPAYVDPLVDWTMDIINEQGEMRQLFTDKMMTGKLIAIHNRSLISEPIQIKGFNGCCAPGVRRSYVRSNGEIIPCEKIGICPSIGNVFTGFDKKAIVEKYIDGYEKESIDDCNNCWAFNICGVCYIRCYSETKLDREKKRHMCDHARRNASSSLVLYHELMENNPEMLSYLNDIEIS